jgi:ATP-binding cassette subfamily F protein 3
MRQALAVALQEYPGAVVLVSHDRHLLNAVADQLFLVDGGRVTTFDGDLQDYAEWASQAAAVKAPVAAGDDQDTSVAAAEVVPGRAADRRQRRREAAAQRAALAPLTAAVGRSEKELERLIAQLAGVEQQLAEPASYQPDQKSRLRELLQSQHELGAAIRGAEAAWLEAHEQLEAAEREQPR